MVPAALSFGLNISLMFVSVTRTSVAHSQFIVALAPLVLAPLGLVMFQERPAPGSLRWGALSFGGLVVVLAFGSDDGVATVAGDLLAVGGMLGFVGYLAFTKRARARGVGTLDFVAILMPVAVVTATPVAALTSDSLWPASGETWVAIAILAVLTGMIGHALLVYRAALGADRHGGGDPGVAAGAGDVLGMGVSRGVDRVRSGAGNGPRHGWTRTGRGRGAARGGSFRHAHTWLNLR